MRRLLTFPSPRLLRDLTLFAAFFTLVFFLLLQYLNQQLAPHGIVAFEFAFTPARAGRMLADWGDAGQMVAERSLVIDFRFMPAYAFLFAGLTLMTARAAQGEWQAFGLDLTLVPFGAWLLDAVENLALMQVLRNPAAPPAAALVVAGVSATIKFLLLLLSLAYIVGVSVLNWRARHLAPPAAEAPAAASDASSALDEPAPPHNTQGRPPRE